MKKTLITFIAALTLVGCSGNSAAPVGPATTVTAPSATFQVYTNATLVSRSDVQQWCNDFTLQVQRDVNPVWHKTATFTLVSVAPKTGPAILVVDHGIAAANNAQGYYQGTTATVDVYQSIHQNGTPEASAGKEYLEILCGANTTGAVAPYAYPVEGPQSSDPKQVLHDFLLPSWFVKGSKGPWDFMNVTTGPGVIAKGGLSD